MLPNLRRAFGALSDRSDTVEVLYSQINSESQSLIVAMRTSSDQFWVMLQGAVEHVQWYHAFLYGLHLCKAIVRQPRLYVSSILQA